MPPVDFITKKAALMSVTPQTKLTRPVSAASAKAERLVRRWPALDWLVIGAMLVVSLLSAWLPVGWTRDYKRYNQPGLYWQLTAGVSLVYAIAGWWVWQADEKAFRRRGWVLAGLVLLPNLLNIWVRYKTELQPGQPLFGRDSDIGLYFKYAHDFATGLKPTFQNHPMEYPQGALLVFWLAERLSRGKLETFYWVFPGLMLAFQLLGALALFGIGRKIGRSRVAFVMAAGLVGSPFLMPYNYTRFDMVPAALLLAGVYCFLPGAGPEGFRLLGRNGSWQSGLLLAVGFVVKWLPVVTAPFMAVAYWRTGRRRELILFGAVLAGLSVVVLAPFWLVDQAAFWYPLQWQSSRKLTGESFWYLLQYQFFDSQHTIPARPWSEPALILLDNNLLQYLQIGLVAALFGLTLGQFRRLNQLNRLFDGWAGAGLLAVAVFTLANRVFSPQYWVLIGWALAATLVLRAKNGLEVAAGLVLLTVAGLANFLVFHLGAFPEQWINYSWLFFGASWLLTGWLIWRGKGPTASQAS